MCMGRGSGTRGVPQTWGDWGLGSCPRLGTWGIPRSDLLELELERGGPSCELWRLRWKNQDLGEEAAPGGLEPICPRL